MSIHGRALGDRWLRVAEGGAALSPDALAFDKVRGSGTNNKRVERIWRREGLKVTAKHPARPAWLADGSCIRIRPKHRNHVWSYDFVDDRTHNGRK
jgi:hypothetical protein